MPGLGAICGDRESLSPARSQVAPADSDVSPRARSAPSRSRPAARTKRATDKRDSTRLFGIYPQLTRDRASQAMHELGSLMDDQPVSTPQARGVKQFDRIMVLCRCGVVSIDFDARARISVVRISGARIRMVLFDGSEGLLDYAGAVEACGGSFEFIIYAHLGGSMASRFDGFRDYDRNDLAIMPNLFPIRALWWRRLKHPRDLVAF